MTKILLTVAGTIIAAAVVSAIVMIANAPAQSSPVLGPVLPGGAHPPASVATDLNTGRITLKFVPADEAVDRR